MEVLAPGVQDGGDADVGAEVLGIGGDGGERLGRGLEQQSIDLGLVLVGDRADRGRQREHEVEIRHRQKLGFARRKPCRRSRPLAFRAVPVAAGIVGDARVGTVLAALDMTAERGGATNLDRRHDAPLGEAHVAGVGRAPRLTMAAEDIRHLELRPNHVGLASGRRGRLPAVPGRTDEFSLVKGRPHWITRAGRIFRGRARMGPINHRKRNDSRGQIRTLHEQQRTEPGIDGLARTNLRFS